MTPVSAFGNRSCVVLDDDPTGVQTLAGVRVLLDWDEKRVWAYIAVNEIPYNPLHDSGYRSIGCIPCTRPTRPDEEERAGRWAGSDKLECGIHGDAPLGGASVTAKGS